MTLLKILSGFLQKQFLMTTRANYPKYSLWQRHFKNGEGIDFL
jgi:hypothetical protein